MTERTMEIEHQIHLEHEAQKAAYFLAEEKRRALDGVRLYGQLAYEFDEPIDSNPYEEWQPEYRLWRVGYQDAQLAAQPVREREGGY